MCGAWCRMRPIYENVRPPHTVDLSCTGCLRDRRDARLRCEPRATSTEREGLGHRAGSRPRRSEVCITGSSAGAMPPARTGATTPSHRSRFSRWRSHRRLSTPRDDGWGRPRGRRRAVPAAARRQHADRECRGGVDPGIHWSGLDGGDSRHGCRQEPSISRRQGGLAGLLLLQGKLPQRQQPPDWRRRGSLLVCPTFLRSRHSRGRDRGRLGARSQASQRTQRSSRCRYSRCSRGRTATAPAKTRALTRARATSSRRSRYVYSLRNKLRIAAVNLSVGARPTHREPTAMRTSWL